MLHKFWDKYLCNLPLDSGRKKWYNGMLMRIRPSASENRPAPMSNKWDSPKNGTGNRGVRKMGQSAKWDTHRTHKKGVPLKGHHIFLSNLYYNLDRLFLTDKSIIPNKFPHCPLNPFFSIAILIS